MGLIVLNVKSIYQSISIRMLFLLWSLLAVGCTTATHTNDTVGFDQQEYIKRLSSNLYYPQEARSLSLEGTAMIQTDINQKGSVIGLTILESSGHTILDTAATKTILATKFPKHTAPHPITVVFPMAYQLEDK